MRLEHFGELESCMVSKFDKTIEIVNSHSRLMFVSTTGYTIWWKNFGEGKPAKTSTYFIDFNFPNSHQKLGNYTFNTREYDGIILKNIGKPHFELCKWSIENYIEGKPKDDQRRIKKYFFDGKSTTDCIQKFLQQTGMIRVNWKLSEGAELNIESHHPLTSSQRRFFIDLIESYNIIIDKIYIDDYSKEQCIKRQLGLNYVL
mgnify:CR=1 FL=1